jgi:hypothetical protein
MPLTKCSCSSAIAAACSQCCPRTTWTVLLLLATTVLQSAVVTFVLSVSRRAVLLELLIWSCAALQALWPLGSLVLLLLCGVCLLKPFCSIVCCSI